MLWHLFITTQRKKKLNQLTFNNLKMEGRGGKKRRVCYKHSDIFSDKTHLASSIYVWLPSAPLLPDDVRVLLQTTYRHLQVSASVSQHAESENNQQSSLLPTDNNSLWRRICAINIIKDQLGIIVSQPFVNKN